MTRLFTRFQLPLWLAVPCLILGGMAPGAMLSLGTSVAAAEGSSKAGQGTGSFSPEEVKTLASGRLVQRPVLRRRGKQKLMGGTSFQVIDAPVDLVWQALLDTPRYPRMMPEVVEAKLVERHGERRTVFLRQGRTSFLQTTYYLDVDVNSAEHDISFRIDKNRPHDLRTAYGFYNIRPFEGASGGPARTLLSYGIMADIGGGFLAALARDTVHEWMLKTPWMVKRFIESSGVHIYKNKL